MKAQSKPVLKEQMIDGTHGLKIMVFMDEIMVFFELHLWNLCFHLWLIFSLYRSFIFGGCRATSRYLILRLLSLLALFVHFRDLSGFRSSLMCLFRCPVDQCLRRVCLCVFGWWTCCLNLQGFRRVHHLKWSRNERIVFFSPRDSLIIFSIFLQEIQESWWVQVNWFVWWIWRWEV